MAIFGAPTSMHRALPRSRPLLEFSAASLTQLEASPTRFLGVLAAGSGGPGSGTSIECPSQLLKPTEPGPEDCCQTGCKECVWEVYWREYWVRLSHACAWRGKGGGVRCEGRVWGLALPLSQETSRILRGFRRLRNWRLFSAGIRSRKGRAGGQAASVGPV